MQPTEIPRWIVFQLVESCNLRCPMCYEWGIVGSYGQHRAAHLDFGVVRRVVEDCLHGKPFFELFGGEPFLHPRISDVIKLIGDAGCGLGIPTNGTLLGEFTDALVGESPIRLWISLDGPESINDRQRGEGVYRRAIGGLDKLHAARESRGCTYPHLGVTYVVTPLNFEHVQRFFFESVELEKLDFIIIVLQNFATEDECNAYQTIVTQQFGGSSARHARGYFRDVDHFSGIDLDSLSEQIGQVKNRCRDKDVQFFSNPRTTDPDNLTSYFTARWSELADRRAHCAFPWMYAEVSARGEVTTCHSFYDITVGNVYDQGILDIWTSEKIRQLRDHLRGELFPICTACCRYYNNPTTAIDIFTGRDTPGGT